MSTDMNLTTILSAVLEVGVVIIGNHAFTEVCDRDAERDGKAGEIGITDSTHSKESPMYH